MQKRNKRYRINKKRLIVLILIIILSLISIIIGIKSIVNFKENNRLKITEYSVFPEEVYGIKVNNDILEEGMKRRPGIKRLIKYIVIHETGNKDKGANAKMHSTFIKNNSDLYTSWHYTVDETEIYHHIPDNEIAYHAGDGKGEGNTNGIGIELCINKDGDFNKTFNNAAKLVAYLLKEYKLNVNDIKLHKDFNNKDCPHNILKDNRIDEFKKEVKKFM